MNILTIFFPQVQRQRNNKSRVNSGRRLFQVPCYLKWINWRAQGCCSEQKYLPLDNTVDECFQKLVPVLPLWKCKHKVGKWRRKSLITSWVTGHVRESSLVDYDEIVENQWKGVRTVSPYHLINGYKEVQNEKGLKDVSNQNSTSACKWSLKSSDCSPTASRPLTPTSSTSSYL